jgi:hypothetical protein
MRHTVVMPPKDTLYLATLQQPCLGPGNGRSFSSLRSRRLRRGSRMFPGMNAEGLGKQARKAMERSRALATQVRTMLSLDPFRSLQQVVLRAPPAGSGALFCGREAFRMLTKRSRDAVITGCESSLQLVGC